MKSFQIISLVIRSGLFELRDLLDHAVVLQKFIADFSQFNIAVYQNQGIHIRMFRINRREFNTKGQANQSNSLLSVF